MEGDHLESIELSPIGVVRRMASEEDVRDRDLLCEIVLIDKLASALDRLDEWSHIYVIYWLDQVEHADGPVVHFPGKEEEGPPLGIFATRAPIHPNPIGLTLVELVKREGNTLVVRGLDAYDGTPVLDLKPYPDWEQGQFIVVTDFRAPEWVTSIVELHTH
jgi:tRNA-Thr(GGU) m(6)t(6)A37 methyltransferase TsaA